MKRVQYEPLLSSIHWNFFLFLSTNIKIVILSEGWYRTSNLTQTCTHTLAPPFVFWKGKKILLPFLRFSNYAFIDFSPQKIVEVWYTKKSRKLDSSFQTLGSISTWDEINQNYTGIEEPEQSPETHLSPTAEPSQNSHTLPNHSQYFQSANIEKNTTCTLNSTIMDSLHGIGFWWMQTMPYNVEYAIQENIMTKSRTCRHI